MSDVIEGELVASSEAPATGAAEKPIVFTFGDVEGVLDRREILSYVECYRAGRWYEPPVSFDGLTRSFEMAPHHASAIRLKVNLLTKHFIPTRYLDRANFRRAALDYLVLGNLFLQRIDNMANRPMRLEHSLGRFTRRGIEDGAFFFVPGWKQEFEFAKGSVCHLMQEHPSQEIYGLPEYLSAIQAGLLNEAATLFRRRYYANGSHAGFILYMNGADFGDVEVAGIKKAMREAKGPGNFKNLFLHIPAGKPDGVKVIPIAEVAAKDEFTGIKNTSRDDMLAAHRVPPQLLGVVPQNNGGFGDVGKANDIFFANEIEPLEVRLLEINDWLGAEAVAFSPYEPVSASAPASS